MTDTSNDLPRSPISAAALRSTVEIKVVTQYLAAQSSPATSQYAFAYTVHITNNGNQSVQLIARRWLIVDDNDEVQEVAGEGVIGQKPHIAPGQSFHYTSGAMLQTPFGNNARRLRDDHTERRTLLSRHPSVSAKPPRFSSLNPHFSAFSGATSLCVG